MRTWAERGAARDAAALRRRPRTTLRPQTADDASVATASACTACAAVSAHAGTLRSAAVRRRASGRQQQRQHRDQRRGRSCRFHLILLSPRRSLDEPFRTSARNATATRIASAAYSMLFAYRVQRAIVHARSRARLRSSEIDRGKRWFLGGASLGGEERIAFPGRARVVTLDRLHPHDRPRASYSRLTSRTWRVQVRRRRLRRAGDRGGWW